MPEFRIQRCLGRGGFGEVYRGVMSRGGGLEVDVAIKVLRPDLEPSSQGVQRLRDEGRLLGRLTHPTILRVYDLVVVDGRAALVTEFVAGDDLARLLHDQEMPARAVFEVIAQVAAALDAAWSWPSVTDGKPLHLVHRDIKPDNIRIDPNGVVKLLDFGIAQARTVKREAHTSVNVIMGSTQYLAPERLVQQEVGPESDVFALGCTVFEALTGEALFIRKSMRQMYLLMVDPERFDEFVADRCETMRGKLGSDRAMALVRAMTAYRKGDRPSAADVAARCDLISDSTPGPTLTQWCRGRQWPPPQLTSGPLDGRVFETAASLAEAELDTLQFDPPASSPPVARADNEDTTEPPDEPTDPGLRTEEDREPVLGELDADPLDTDHAERATAARSIAGTTPWSGAEMAALFTEESAAPTRRIDVQELVGAGLVPDTFRVPQLARQRWEDEPEPEREPEPEPVPDQLITAPVEVPEPVTVPLDVPASEFVELGDDDEDHPTVRIQRAAATAPPPPPVDPPTARIEPEESDERTPPLAEGTLELAGVASSGEHTVEVSDRPDATIELPQAAHEPTRPVPEAEEEDAPQESSGGLDELPLPPSPPPPVETPGSEAVDEVVDEAVEEPLTEPVVVPETEAPPKRRRRKAQSFRPYIALASSFAGLAVGIPVLLVVAFLLWLLVT